MCNQEISSLSRIIAELGIENTQRFLSTAFFCDKNEDIEHFLYNNAVRFELARASKTFLMIDSVSGKISAYFTLSFKTIEVNAISKNRLKKLTGGLTNSRRINVYLIAQLGKNTRLSDNNVCLKSILKFAFSKISLAQSSVGGKTVILECEENEKLINHYEKHGFSLIDTVDESDLKTLFIIPEFE